MGELDGERKSGRRMDRGSEMSGGDVRRGQGLCRCEVINLLYARMVATSQELRAGRRPHIADWLSRGGRGGQVWLVPRGIAGSKGLGTLDSPHLLDPSMCAACDVCTVWQLSSHEK